MAEMISNLVRRGLRALEWDTPPRLDPLTRNLYSEEWNDVEESIFFVFSPVPVDIEDKAKLQHVSWIAKMTIKTRDLPRLMREGLHWTAANVLHELPLVSTEPGYVPIHFKEGCAGIRTWFLSDIGKDCKWAAAIQLYVNAREAGVLSQFEVADLRPDMIIDVIALAEVQSRPGDPTNRDLADSNSKSEEVKDSSSKCVYYFCSSHPSFNFNKIYDDMPLEGWWPWPKKASGEGKEGGGPEKKELIETTDKPPAEGALRHRHPFQRPGM